MSEHTPEPWIAEPLPKTSEWGLREKDDETFISIGMERWDAERAAACVNACAGIGFGPDGIDQNEIGWITKELGRGSDAETKVEDLEQAIRERDERIAAQQNVLVRVGIGIGALDDTQEHYGLKRIWREELQPLLAETDGGTG